MKKLFLYIILFLGIFLLCFLLANEYFNYHVQQEQTSEVTTEKKEDSVAWTPPRKQGKYVVGISDDHVIVYMADTQKVYEYTEIDVEILKSLHPETYTQLVNQVYLESELELYRYLESLST